MFEVPVEYDYEDQVFVFSGNFAGKMTIPSKSLLSFLASCSLYWYAYAAIPTTCYIMPPILACQASNPPFLANLLFGYVTAFAQPLLQRCQLQVKLMFVPCWNMVMLGYHNISYLINASIYLVKDGRLGRMPGVLFHSCLPSFRHAGVMFLDFAFLTRLVVMGTPRQFALNKTPPARPNLGFTFA